jgi:pyruvate kinase
MCCSPPTTTTWGTTPPSPSGAHAYTVAGTSQRSVRTRRVTCVWAGVCLRSYKRLAQDVHPGSQVLIADGSCVLEVLECYPSFGTVKCRALNSATLG